MVISSAPSFAVPFIAGLALAPSQSDALLLCAAIGTTVVLVVGTAAETSVVGAIGSTAGVHRVGRRTLQATAWRVSAHGSVPLILTYSAVVGAFSFAFGGLEGLLNEVAPFATGLLIPVLALISSVFAGYLTAANRIATLLVANGMRMVPLFVALVLGSSEAVLGAAILLGELARLCIVIFFSLRLAGQHVELEPQREIANARILSTSSLLVQSAWTSTSQLNVVFARAYFAWGPVGAFTMGEMAFRIQNVASQMAISGFVMSRVAAIPTEFARSLSISEIRKRSARAILWCLRVGSAFSGLVVMGAAAATILGLGEEDSRNALWLGAVLSLSCGPIAASTWASRMIVFCSRNRVLLAIGASASVVIGVALFVATMFPFSLWIPVIVTVTVLTLAAVAYANVARKSIEARYEN